MTICNMSIEAGARAGMIAPDETTFEYLAGREFAPRARRGTRPWRAGSSCPPTKAPLYDQTITLDADGLEPMITYGTNPGMGMPITGRVPDPG